MQYELYVDSLFLVNFVMNLYLIMLVNRKVKAPSGPGRLLAGAGIGALSYFLPFLIPGPAWFRACLGMAMGVTGMIFTAFSVRSAAGFFKILEKLLVYSFFLGGLFLFLINRVPIFRRSILNIFGILGLGAVGFLFLRHFLRERKKCNLCQVTLIRGAERVCATGLIDSGNSLFEPISGKPVSVIGESIFHGLWKEEGSLFRAIPYHSIGRKRGILQGYLLPELQIELEGEAVICKDVYVAVSEELGSKEKEEKRQDADTAAVKVILHPGLLKRECRK